MPEQVLFTGDRSARSNVIRLLVGLGVLAALGLLAYERFAAPPEGPQPWTPPAGLARADTPDWLQTLCADQTPELCAAADGARRAEECETMVPALKRLEAVARKLKARGALASRQHWVLVELYGQGNDLCQFTPGK